MRALCALIALCVAFALCGCENDQKTTQDLMNKQKEENAKKDKNWQD